ncbi:hypothetical protein KAS50_07490 [bacterium]|nr:hypothetical protein [bacterium]
MKKIIVTFYGIFGFCVIITAEVILLAGSRFLGTWFTPIVWTGYILFIDSIIYRKKGASFISCRFGEFILLLFLSVGFWLIFEWYNLFMNNWHYINLPEDRLIRYIGYAWSFSTIYPAIFETRDFLESYGFFKTPFSYKIEIKKEWLVISIVTGLAFLIIPVIYPSEYHSPLVWTGLVLFLEPVNYLLGGGSFLRDLERGVLRKFLTHFTAGIICGFLWEFWNYWAFTKWIYTVPYWGDVKIFEMPVIGYLGFPAFALECYVMYSTAVIIMKKIKPEFESYFVNE